MKSSEKPGMVALGKVGSPAGLKGEFRVTLHAAGSSNLKEGKNLLFRHAAGRRPAQERGREQGSPEFSAICLRVRYQGDRPVVSVEGITDRTAAESIRGMEIYIEEDQLDELPEGEHYVKDIIGCRVRDLASGRDIGILKDVIQNTAQSVLDIETPEGEQVLIPAVDEFMRSIDEEAGIIEVELIPGFI